MTEYAGRFEKTPETDLYLEEIPLETAAEFVLQHHYSKVMPKQTKLVLGARKGVDGPLVGVITFGWGVRPQETLRALFPSLDNGPGFIKQYLEIGKMCMLDSQPKNSESRLLALAARYVKRHRPDVKLIFTWADALWGKPGYVYQAANYYYGGFIQTDVYMDRNGVRFHPRQLPAILRTQYGICTECVRCYWKADNGIGVCRPSKKQLVEEGWKHVFGLQFRYVYFLCDEKERDRLIADSANARFVTYTSTKSKKLPGSKGMEKVDEIKTVKTKAVHWVKGSYPKADALRWKIDDGKERDGKPSKPVACGKPEFGAAFDPNRLSKDDNRGRSDSGSGKCCYPKHGSVPETQLPPSVRGASREDRRRKRNQGA